MEKIMNTAEYAAMRNISQQAVRKAIVMKHKMPNVIEILPKTGKYWLLKVLINNKKR